MHCHEKNYFQGGLSESAKIRVHTIDYKCGALREVPLVSEWRIHLVQGYSLSLKSVVHLVIES